MELEKCVIRVATAFKDSSKCMEGKELENILVQTEDKAIVSIRTEIRMVTLLRVEMMEVLSEGNSKTIISMDMHI